MEKEVKDKKFFVIEKEKFLDSINYRIYDRKMYDFGTPCTRLGWALPKFSSKKSICSGTSIGTHYAITTYVVSAYPIRVCRICGSYLNHKPYCEIKSERHFRLFCFFHFVC